MKEESKKNKPKLSRDWTTGKIKSLLVERRKLNAQLLNQCEQKEVLIRERIKLVTEEIDYLKQYVDEDLKKGLLKK